MHTIEHFQSLVVRLFGTLAFNSSAAYKEYMSGQLNRGAWELIVNRETGAHNAATGKDFVSLDALLQAFSTILIDVGTGLRDQPDADTQAAVDEIKTIYRERGFVTTPMGFFSHPNAKNPDFPTLCAAAPTDQFKVFEQFQVGARLTHIEPKRGVNDMKEGIEYKRKPVDIPLDVFKSAIDNGMLRLDSWSGIDPELYAQYTTYEVLSTTVPSVH